MPYLTLVESAIKLGIGVELVEYFINNCPKYGESKTLTAKSVDGEMMIDEKALLDYQRYLNSPWPLSAKAKRPATPPAIKKDIALESHLGCAICGSMDSGEVAHIEAVSHSYNNSPDNLIYLCPNHHTKYDLGYKPSKNVTLDMVRAAKLLKRKSRQRMMAYEANAINGLHGLIQLIKSIGKNLKNDDQKDEVEILTTEAKKLLELIPQLVEAAEEQARNDQPDSEMERIIAENAPTFAKLASAVKTATSQHDVRYVVDSVTDKSHEILLVFDEEECPHCGGRGMTGLVGDYCAYCKGSCLVTQQEAQEYDRRKINEEECPHCQGRGTTGLRQNYCRFCGGSCVVSKDEAEEYETSEIDEVPCPHCDGRGTVGYNQNFCGYCRGDCVMSREREAEYARDSLDEIACPHCEGRGWRGRNQNTCVFCGGDSVMTKAEAAEYNSDEVDEECCPRCNGRGTNGLSEKNCQYCYGNGLVSREKAKEYDSDDIDEIECPKCQGRGTYGHIGDLCKLCRGNCVVTEEVRNAFILKYGTD
jgi:hypothetical protein